MDGMYRVGVVLVLSLIMLLYHSYAIMIHMDGVRMLIGYCSSTVYPCTFEFVLFSSYKSQIFSSVLSEQPNPVLFFPRSSISSLSRLLPSLVSRRREIQRSLWVKSESDLADFVT
ncbi:hypothetical protein RJT34_18961 [Clitoria ternatea]|uniref:Uncharacterized protein n=1 Tax=Clitoria ternatea TaxID=43366 RepID=A0AAN9IQC3_CLITE